MKQRIWAFYDVLIYSIVCVPFMVLAIIIMAIMVFQWYNAWVPNDLIASIILGACVGICMGGIPLINGCTIDTEGLLFFYFPWTTSWKKARDNIDINWNLMTNLSEIDGFEVVKLTEEEKQTKVFYKHRKNKYLKINLKYGKCKYVYVGNYSDKQIRDIMALVRINQRDNPKSTKTN